MPYCRLGAECLPSGVDFPAVALGASGVGEWVSELGDGNAGERACGWTGQVRCGLSKMSMWVLRRSERSVDIRGTVGRLARKYGSEHVSNRS